MENKNANMKIKNVQITFLKKKSVHVSGQANDSAQADGIQFQDIRIEEGKSPRQFHVEKLDNNTESVDSPNQDGILLLWQRIHKPSWDLRGIGKVIPFRRKEQDSGAVLQGASAIGFQNITGSISNWSTAFKTKLNSKVRMALIGIAGILAVVGIIVLTVWLIKSMADAPVKAYEIYFGGRDLGVVEDVAGIQKTLEDIKQEFRQTYNMDVVVEQDLEAREVWISKDSIGTQEDVEEAIRKSIDVKVNAAAILVNGKVVAVTRTEEEAQWILERILEPYQELKDEPNIESIDFAEDVKIQKMPVEFGMVEDKEKLYQDISLGTQEENIYVVQAGDSLWSISKRYKIKLNDIRSANPVVANTDIIQPGMELNLIVPKKKVNVEVVKVEEYSESIDYGTEVRKDDSLYKSQKKVIQRGQKGKKNVVARVTSVNGVETKREILKETITAEPKKQIVAEGTKALPKNVNAGSISISSFGLPIKGRISSRYGRRWGRMHEGVDIAAPTGTPIYAAESGTVSYAGTRGGYGKLVEINHGGGVRTRYGHCSKILVKKGQKVKRGELIALVGSTGNSTGPHVHYEIRINGKAVDPLKYRK